MSQKNLFVETCDEIGQTSTKVMKSLGLYPFVNKSRRQKFYSVFIIVSILVTFTQITIAMVQARTETLVEIADRGSIFGCGVLGLVKIFLFVYRGADYHDLVTSLSDDKWYQEDDFIAEEYEEIVRFYLNVFKKINIFLLTVAIIVLNVFVASPLLIMGYHKFFDPDNYVRFLPFDVWNGFVDKEKRFWEVFLYETLMQAFIVLLFLAYDAFNLAVMIQIYIHLECLLKAIYPVVTEADKLALEKLSRNDAEFKVISEKVYARLSTLIGRYSKIVGMCSLFESLVGPVLMINFLFGSIFICLTGFIVTVVEDLHRKIKFLGLFLAMLTVIFDNCLFGQHLINLSLTVPEAIYTSFWYLTDIKIQKSMVFVLLRSQKPMKLSAMGYVDMNCITFTSLASTSWSYFNLLRQAYSD